MTGSDSGRSPDAATLPQDRSHIGQFLDDTSYYEKGNNSSRLFFTRMQASHAEASDIKKQCAVAASASPARWNAERMNLDRLRQNISSSRRSAEVAKNAILKEGSCRQVLGQTPKDLGHLALPKISWDSLGLAETEFVLPGAVDSSKDNEETVRDLTQPFITGIRDTGPDLELLERAAVPQKKLSMILGPEKQRVSSEATEAAARRLCKRGSKQRLSSKGSSRRSSKFLTANWAVTEADGDDFDSGDEGIGTIRPQLGFKNLMQFGKRFQPPSAANDRTAIHQAAEDHDHLLKRERDVKIYHPVLGWISHQCRFTIETGGQLEAAFPIVALTILDAVYAKRVKWTEVDWDVRYVSATAKNFVLLLDLWKQVHMDAHPDFKHLPPFMRLGSMYKAEANDRLHFLVLMQRWFQARIPDSDPYNAMGRRRQYFEQCRNWGRPIQFPSWAHFDPEEQVEDVGEGEQRLLRRLSLAAAPQKGDTRKPEFQRLMNFLGDDQLPTM